MIVCNCRLRLVVVLFVCLLGGGWCVCGQPFELLVTQSPPGPLNQNPATWGGILQYHFDGSGAAPLAGVGVDKALLSDPVGFAFWGASSEVFVGNRHGNINPSSVI